MLVNREKRVEIINENISTVNEYLKALTNTEVNDLMKRMEDILFFYGFTKEFILSILRNGKIDKTFSNLSDLEGVINAMIFQLRYKSGNTARKTGKDANNRT